MPVAYFGTLDYTIAVGDTLGRIAHDYNTTIANILKFNTIPNPDLLHIGQKIAIPLSPPEAVIYTVRRGDSLYSIAEKYGTTVSNMVKYNYLAPPFIIYPGEQLIVAGSLK